MQHNIDKLINGCLNGDQKAQMQWIYRQSEFYDNEYHRTL